MGTHTPGPWTVTRDGETEVREETGRRRLIARVFDTYGDRDPEKPEFRLRTEELLPNAHLIAAAPELYAAIRDLLDLVTRWYEEGQRPDPEFDIVPRTRAAEHAIARAEKRKED